MNKKTLIIGSLAFALVSGIVLIYAALDKGKENMPGSKYESPGEIGTEQNTQLIPGGVDVDILTSKETWNVGEEYDVEVNFSKIPDPFPTVYTLVVNFDPSVLAVSSVDTGNIWSDVNVLQEEIDNAGGRATITVGQGFTANATGGNRLGTVVFEVIANSESQTTEINIVDSAVAKSGLGGEINNRSLIINLSE